MGARFTRATDVTDGLFRDKVTEVIISYMCDSCLRSIPIRWRIREFDNKQLPIVLGPEMILPAREPFDFDHVPPAVAKEISEGLDCLSVGACNGFAAMCRRTIQAICTTLGAEASTKIKDQIEEMAKVAQLNDETKGVAIEIMMVGHDGSHPHLPDVDPERAAILLTLVQDIIYQLFTRPGKMKESGALRKAAISAKKK